MMFIVIKTEIVNSVYGTEIDKCLSVLGIDSLIYADMMYGVGVVRSIIKSHM
jgi:hypothetical protein